MSRKIIREQEAALAAAVTEIKTHVTEALAAHDKAVKGHLRVSIASLQGDISALITARPAAGPGAPVDAEPEAEPEAGPAGKDSGAAVAARAPLLKKFRNGGKL